MNRVGGDRLPSTTPFKPRKVRGHGAFGRFLLRIKVTGMSENNIRAAGAGAGVAIGAGLGAALLAATGNAVWLAVGVAIGAAVGTAVGQVNSDESEDDPPA